MLVNLVQKIVKKEEKGEVKSYRNYYLRCGNSLVAIDLRFPKTKEGYPSPEWRILEAFATDIEKVGDEE